MKRSEDSPASTSERPAPRSTRPPRRSERPPASASEHPPASGSERPAAYKSLRPPGTLSGRPPRPSERPPGASSYGPAPSEHPLAPGSLRAPSIPAEYKGAVDKPKPRRSKRAKPIRAEAAEGWDDFQLRHCLLMLLALLLEVVFSTGYLAAVVGVASLAWMFAVLRKRWTPPGALNASVDLTLARLLMVLPLPFLPRLDAWLIGGVLLMVASVLGAYVVFREREETRVSGFAFTFDQEVSALALAIAATTIVAGERLWGWALWLGALRYLYMVAIRALGTADQIEISTAGRYQHAGTGALVAVVFFPGQHVVLAGAVGLILAFIYGRACLRAAG